MNRVVIRRPAHGGIELEINGIDGMTLKDVLGVEFEQRDEQIDFPSAGRRRELIRGLRHPTVLTLKLYVEDVEWAETEDEFADAAAHDRMRDELRKRARPPKAPDYPAPAPAYAKGRKP